MSVCLITPSYRGDLERCRILCESVDRYVTGFERHKLIVNDEDVSYFKSLIGARRTVEPVKAYLPPWLRPLPFGMRYKGRKVWLSMRTQPVHGWHIQQLVKLAAAANSASEFSINLDSDTVFVRPFDVESWIGNGPASPLLRSPGGITADLQWHPTWLQNATRLLGLPAHTLPADDYVGNIIAWRRETVKSMLDRIERTTGSDWVTALCRSRSFSEYLLYGCHVATDADAGRQHAWMDHSLCASHWDATPLDEKGLANLIATLKPSQVALAIQSFSNTPGDLIRKVADLEAA
jgi:hypothetical protein